MWARAIKGLCDIPDPERDFLTLLFKTGIVEECVLLTFDTPSSVTDTPYLSVLGLTQKPKSDLLHCRIHGRGSKQNCQDVNLIVTKGVGEVVVAACPNRIESQLLDFLLDK